MSNIIVELKHVGKRYGDTQVLKDVNIEIEQGKFYTLLGPSGSGKTTILRAIAGFLDVSEGEVLFDGKRINDVPANQRKVNTVFQDYALFPHLNVFDNVAFGLRLHRMSKETIKTKVTDALKMVRLQGYADREISELSGGQQQRVAIARALALHPDILCFDEPTSALDPELIGEVLEVMQKLAQEGMTMVCVTHEMHFARRVANRIVFLEGGVIVEEGTPDEFFEHPKTERARQFLGKFESQFD